VGSGLILETTGVAEEVHSVVLVLEGEIASPDGWEEGQEGGVSSCSMCVSMYLLKFVQNY